MFIFKLCILGLTLQNQISFEFKFDDTRLSSQYENKIGPIKEFFCCILTLQSQNATKKSMGPILFYNMGKVCCHQIWIQNYFGFIVLILMHIVYALHINLHLENLDPFLLWYCSVTLKIFLPFLLCLNVRKDWHSRH